jgi:hypothetical protein
MLEELYPHLAGFHALFRWILLALGVFAVFLTFAGWNAATPPGKNLLRLGVAFALALDLELITGVLLYFGASPGLRGAFVGHGVAMLMAVLLAHVGGALTRKAPTDALKYRAPAIAWTLSLLVMLAGIPRH